MQGAIVQVEAQIGQHCIINTGASVDHECRLGDFVHLSPHTTLCGNVHVGEGTWIGAGTTVIQGVKIGRWSVIGAGSVVTKDIPDGVVAVGTICKPIKEINRDMLNKLTGGGYLQSPLDEALNGLEGAVKTRGNVLITSAGKRVTLVQLFQKELKKVNPEGKVLTTEMNPALSPAGHVSDGCFQVDRVTAPGYLEELLKLCVEQNVRVVVPTIDTELVLLSQNKELFARHGVALMVADYDFVKLCRDKRNTNEFFEAHDIRFPKPVDAHNAPTYPMFAKPYDGSLSKDLHVIRSAEDLTQEILDNPKLIYMEYIDKKVYKEYTVDMYYGHDHQVKAIVPRERVEIRAGEINKGYTRKNYLVNYLKERMGKLPGVVGCICIQLFYNEETNDVVGIEINPRFGGGYPMSYHAGANFPKYIMQEYFEGQDIAYTDDWTDNLLLLRYDAEVIVQP